MAAVHHHVAMKQMWLVLLLATSVTSASPWNYQFNHVPAYPGLKVAASYSGPWSRQHDYVNADGTAFNLGANQTVKAPPLALKTTMIK
jgi:hypothetical protein